VEDAERGGVDGAADDHLRLVAEAFGPARDRRQPLRIRPRREQRLRVRDLARELRVVLDAHEGARAAHPRVEVVALHPVTISARSVPPLIAEMQETLPARRRDCGCGGARCAESPAFLRAGWGD